MPIPDVSKSLTRSVHDLFGKLSRCQWSGSIAQHVVDQTQTLTRTEPGIVGSRLPGSDLFRPTVRIDQPHGRIEMRQASATFDQFPLQVAHHPSQFRSLVAQRTDDLAQCRPPIEIPTAATINAKGLHLNECVVAEAT